jgi:hypothetical protein
MATGYEVRAYADLGTIADELTRIRKLLMRLADHIIPKEEPPEEEAQ